MFKNFIFILTLLCLAVFSAYFISKFQNKSSENKEKYTKLSFKEIESFIPNLNNFIIDTRNYTISNKGYLKNSLLIPLSVDYEKWFTLFIDKGSNVILISDEENYEKAYNQTISLGSYKIVGYAIYDEIIKEENLDIKVAEYNENTKEDVEKLTSEGAYLLDIREIKEYEETGVIKEAHLIPLSTFKSEYSKITKEENVYIFCRKGVRALLAMSFLQRSGYTNKLIIMRDGMEKIIKEGYSLDKYSG